MNSAPVVTYGSVARRLYEARDRAELDRAAHLIQYLQSDTDRNFAAGIVKARSDQLQPAAQQGVTNRVKTPQ